MPRRRFRCSMWGLQDPIWINIHPNSLDVSMQAQIVNLFKHLQKEHGFSFLFIAHDLSMVKFLCDRVGVMYQGRLVETGTVEEIFGHPVHPYTRRLVEAVPVLDFG